jgi:hypothetical protein
LQGEVDCLHSKPILKTLRRQIDDRTRRSGKEVQDLDRRLPRAG